MSIEHENNKKEYGEIATNKKLKDALMRRDKQYSHWIIEADRRMLNEFVYSNKDILKNRVLPSYYWLKSIAEKGSTVAVPIIVDIETAIKLADFEPKELKILEMWMQGYTQIETAEAFYDYRQNIARVVDSCVGRLWHIFVHYNLFN